jgi:hypothetical protein
VPIELFGPSALLVAALMVVGALWREHLRHDADVRKTRDEAIIGWRGQSEATKEVAAMLASYHAAVERRRTR